MLLKYTFIGFSILSVIFGFIMLYTIWTNYQIFALFQVVFCSVSACALISLGLWKDKKAINV